jgi:hypothetical protein
MRSSSAAAYAIDQRGSISVTRDSDDIPTNDEGSGIGYFYALKFCSSTAAAGLLQYGGGATSYQKTRIAPERLMFEDETVDVKCPKCGHLNSVLVHEIEEHAETHFVCVGCKAGVRLEANEFRQQHLSHVRDEVAELERDAARQANKGKRPTKDDFEI